MGQQTSEPEVVNLENPEDKNPDILDNDMNNFQDRKFQNIQNKHLKIKTWSEVCDMGSSVNKSSVGGSPKRSDN